MFFIRVMPSDDRRQEPHYGSAFRTHAARDEDGLFKYALVTVGDGRHDPWALAQAGLETNPHFAPLIAVNPYYQHPLVIAKRLATLANLYPGRRLAVNLVEGSFFQELSRAGDHLQKEQRSQRLLEFLHVLRLLVETPARVSFDGKYYQLAEASMYPGLGASQVEIFVSGAQFKRQLDDGVFGIANLRPEESVAPPPGAKNGLALGICARETRAEAKSALHLLFPEDRKGQFLFGLASKNAESNWNLWLRQNREMWSGQVRDSETLVSFRPIENFWSTAPYLVGSYQEIAIELLRLKQNGNCFFLIDFHPTDLEHVRLCLSRVQ